MKKINWFISPKGSKLVFNTRLTGVVGQAPFKVEAIVKNQH
jgi:hypothetical protein